MGRQLIAILAATSLLGSEALGNVNKHVPYWIGAPDHNHTEAPESDAGAYSRTIVVDSSAAATAATGTIDFLRSLGMEFAIMG